MSKNFSKENPLTKLFSPPWSYCVIFMTVAAAALLVIASNSGWPIPILAIVTLIVVVLLLFSLMVVASAIAEVYIGQVSDEQARKDCNEYMEQHMP